MLVALCLLVKRLANRNYTALSKEASLAHGAASKQTTTNKFQLANWKHNSVVGIAPYVVHSTPGKRYFDFRPDCVVTRLGERLCNFVKPQVKRVQPAT